MNKKSLKLLEASKVILDFYFGNVKKETILSIAGSSEDEFDEKSVLKVAKESNLYAKIEPLEIKNIQKFMLPFIAVGKNDAVLVNGFSKDKISIYDLKDKTNKEISKKELKKFDEMILFFRNKQDFILSNKQKELGWFFEPLKASWRAYVEVGILSIFINLFALALPLFTMNVYNRIVPNFATDTLFVLIGGVLIIFIFEIILKTARVYIIEQTGQKIGALYEEMLLERMLGVKTQYDRLLSGTKANLFKELAQIKEFFTSKTLVLILDLPFYFIAVFVIYLISPTIALVPVFAGLLLVGFNLLMQFPLAKLSHEQFKKAQSKNGFLVESISGRDAIKLVNAHTSRLFTWSRVVAFYEKLTKKIQLLQHFTTNASYTIIQSVTLVVVAIGVYEIHAKSLSVGGLIAVTILASRAMVPIASLSNVLLNFKKMKDSLESINEFWHLPREIGEKVNIGIGKLNGEIEFRDVSYIYQGSKYPSLQNINLKIKAGEKVGIIGPTGAGKSTLLRLISLLDTPTKGTLYIDSMPSDTLHPVELRENIGIMPQNPYIFAGSIAENIALSRSISNDELSRLIKLSGLEELIKKSGEGYSLEVGENGSNLSTGQKHLIALARALVHNPSILILDEPTTGLDIGLENSVIQNLKPIVEDKTLLLITHRYSALKLVDRVIVINSGAIVADGKRDEILKMLQGGN
jgi:ATP-binding cassette subfamily B protein/ATP-binding cassette subfamily C protein LapB